MAKKTTKTTDTHEEEFIPCHIEELPQELWADAADVAFEENPANESPVGRIGLIEENTKVADEPQALAVLSSKYWGKGGVKLGVAFLDNPPADLRAKILHFFNVWGQRANVHFSEASAGMAQVRINRAGSGYWSYLGTDVLLVKRTEPTMNLQGFTMGTRESEFHRVVVHECGHTLGFPHEHLRKELIAKLDVAKTLAYFRSVQGWSESMTRSNVLTPLEDRAIIATPVADETSIMSYQLPGSITKDGKPISGGTAVNESDLNFAGKLYPLAVPPPPPPPTGSRIVLSGPLEAGSYLLTRENPS